MLAVVVAKGFVDAASLADQRPDLPVWEPYALELTSAAFFAGLLWPLWQVSRRLRPPQRSWPLAIAAHLALTLPLVALHALWLAGSRKALFAVLGAPYRFDWSTAQFLFEWRKDALALFVFAALFWLFDRLSAPVAPAPAAFRLAVKDGGRTLLLATEEISHANSAGNYVELHTGHGTILHRATLASLAAELAPRGFVRVHRAHVVRVGAVVAVAAEGSGDFAVTLAGGVTLPGSRRYRDGLAGLMG